MNQNLFFMNRDNHVAHLRSMHSGVYFAEYEDYSMGLVLGLPRAVRDYRTVLHCDFYRYLPIKHIFSERRLDIEYSRTANSMHNTSGRDRPS